SSYLPLLRETQQMFRLPMLRRLLPGWLDLDAAAALWREPQAAAARLALEWLMESGKRLRPFLCLAAYAGRRGLLSAACAEEIADSVRRVALALEIMHKASLAHDDIEDEDEQRYGRPTLHRRSSVGEALNAGDLLVGLGYGLIAAAAEGLGARCASDILERLAKAHLRLCRGQGRELAWQREWLAAPRPFSPAEVLTIYAAKTSPAFEICLYAGLRMAGDWQDEALVQAFATALGIAFQIANDSEHWQNTDHGCRGGDAWTGRPTLHLAFALEADADAVRCLWRRRPAGTQSAEMAGWLAEVEKLYHQTAAFAQADALRRKYRHRALALAREFEPQPLADLCAFAVRLALGV
ncbi:MAG: polyprenyl synthetase family protein, partial [Planctomycetota bacterium]|nr:polyprenyl synthetase family protein [Planctomycetota bacterium]